MTQATPTFTPGQERALRNLINAGFAVVVFSPEELQGAKPRVVERHLNSVGHDLILKLTSPPVEA